MGMPVTGSTKTDISRRRNGLMGQLLCNSMSLGLYTPQGLRESACFRLELHVCTVSRC